MGIKLLRAFLVAFSAIMLLSACEKTTETGSDDLDGYWMSDREYSGCKRVYYFDGYGGGYCYQYLSTDSNNWNRDCECHRYNTEYVCSFNGTKYYKQKNVEAEALIYTLIGTSLVVSSDHGADLDYLNYSNGMISGYTKVKKSK